MNPFFYALQLTG